eukprot:scaffold3120_cov26-Tisochrysis_lutea.AAC.5
MRSSRRASARRASPQRESSSRAHSRWYGDPVRSMRSNARSSNRPPVLSTCLPLAWPWYTPVSPPVRRTPWGEATPSIFCPSDRTARAICTRASVSSGIDLFPSTCWLLTTLSIWPSSGSPRESCPPTTRQCWTTPPSSPPSHCEAGEEPCKARETAAARSRASVQPCGGLLDGGDVDLAAPLARTAPCTSWADDKQDERCPPWSGGGAWADDKQDERCPPWSGGGAAKSGGESAPTAASSPPAIGAATHAAIERSAAAYLSSSYSFASLDNFSTANARRASLALLTSSARRSCFSCPSKLSIVLRWRPHSNCSSSAA